MVILMSAGYHACVGQIGAMTVPVALSAMSLLTVLPIKLNGGKKKAQ